MYLYIFRHGEAKSKSEDPERGLTDRGREEVAAVCSVFSKIKPAVDAIWHSGRGEPSKQRVYSQRRWTVQPPCKLGPVWTLTIRFPHLWKN